MRRRLHNYLPAFLIALTVQIFVPIAASWTAAIAASDPIGSAQICRSGASALNQNDDRGGRQHDRCDTCSICCLAAANGSVDTPQIDIFSVPFRAHAQIGWHGKASSVGARYITSAQARAPPVLS